MAPWLSFPDIDKSSVFLMLSAGLCFGTTQPDYQSPFCVLTHCYQNKMQALEITMFHHPFLPQYKGRKRKPSIL